MIQRKPKRVVEAVLKLKCVARKPTPVVAGKLAHPIAQRHVVRKKRMPVAAERLVRTIARNHAMRIKLRRAAVNPNPAPVPAE